MGMSSAVNAVLQFIAPPIPHVPGIVRQEPLKSEPSETCLLPCFPHRGILGPLSGFDQLECQRRLGMVKRSRRLPSLSGRRHLGTDYLFLTTM